MSEEQSYLKSLYAKAVTVEGTPGRPMNPGTWLYRNKYDGYLKNIFDNHDGVMIPCAKDYSGDPKSPINGKLNGLFFCANVHGSTLASPNCSPFGPERFSAPLNALLDKMGKWKTYFTDFYCLTGCPGTHYVTVVLCQEGTEADDFCQNSLIDLPPDNPFFTVNPDGTFWVSSKTWVEIFYTKDINVKEMLETGVAKKSYVPSNGTNRGGIPKNPNCTFCNITFTDKNPVDEMLREK